MRLYRDERGQAIQVGAAILLGFVVVAITLYQVQVVPAQNGEIEVDHNQEAQEDLQDLRNAIRNAASQGTETSVSVNLGTRYPSRTIFVNPPPSQGHLRTEPAGNVSFGNAVVDDPGAYDGNASDLLAEHPTSRIVYAPEYAEYGEAPATTIEHTLALNAFPNGANRTVTDQGVVRDGRLTLAILRGDLSEQGSQAFSMETEVVSGPTDTVTIEPDDSNAPIELHLPTRTPSVWNETIGTTYGGDDGRDGARVAAWDGQRVTVELNRSEYELQMALVGVGDDVDETDRYDVSEVESGGTGGSSGNGSYTLAWTDPSTESANSGAALSNCDSSSCTWDVGSSTDGTLTLNSTLDPTFEGIDMEFAVDNSTVGTVSPQSGTSDSTGANTTVLEANTEGTVQVLSSANDDSDVIDIEVTNVSTGGGGGGGQVLQPVESDGVNGGTQLTFSVENTGSDSVTVTDFSVDVTNDNVRIDNGDSPELEILRASQNGEANRNDPGNSGWYDADGTVYDLVASSTTGGQYAILASTDDDATVDFRGFDSDLGTLEFANSSADADIVVTLQLDDGSVQEFYFRQV